MKQIVTLKEFADEVCKLAKMAGADYYTCSVEIIHHRDGEKKTMFQAYVDSGKLGRGRTMQTALNDLADKINPAIIPETELEIELTETGEVDLSQDKTN